MEIKKKETPLEYLVLEFVDTLGTLCRLWVLKSTHHLRFDLDFAFAQFSQEDIKALLPYLQAFAETSQLEPQEPTHVSLYRVRCVIGSHIEHYAKENDQEALDICDAILQDLGLPETKYAHVQGEDAEKHLLEVEIDLDKAKKGMSYYMRQCDKQVDHIAELEELIGEWWNSRNLSVTALNDLQIRTKKLLGEE